MLVSKQVVPKPNGVSWRMQFGNHRHRAIAMNHHICKHATMLSHFLPARLLWYQNCLTRTRWLDFWAWLTVVCLARSTILVRDSAAIAGLHFNPSLEFPHFSMATPSFMVHQLDDHPWWQGLWLANCVWETSIDLSTRCIRFDSTCGIPLYTKNNWLANSIRWE